MKFKFWLLAFLVFPPACIYAQTDTSKVRTLEIYGFAMTDIGYNVDQINPNWSDALRVTKLPSYANQFAPSGTVYFSARQSRLGVRGWTQTPIGELKAVFEFDMFGVGVDEGQFTIRPRNFYGELGRFLVGQANSPFMDGDVWPNTMEYWGPSGMVFFRNIQFRYAALQGDDEVFIALERPGASADQGSFSNRIELDSVRGQFNVPDLSAHYKKTGKWGHVQLGGMLRSIKWKDIHTTGGYDLSGSTVGWGLNLSTVINVAKQDALRASFVYGEGIENYMQDAPVDVGLIQNSGSSYTPVKGKALPVMGIVAFYDHYWTPKLCTAFGYSSVNITNTKYGSSDAYRMGQYAIINLVATPFDNFLMAAELQWGKRYNFTDGFSSSATKIQFSFKYSFSQTFYRKKS